MKKPRPPENVRWGIYLIRKKAERLGSGEAKDTVDAFTRGIDQLKIAEHEHWRVSVQREPE